MRDPFSWSFPLVRLFGIQVRIHILFPLFALIMWLRVAIDEKVSHMSGATLVVMALLLVAVLLHELGHCFGARLVDGDARDVLLWPLGGLARCDLPHSPRAHFICSAAGPLTNVLLCLVAGLILVACSFKPSFSPWDSQLWYTELYNWAEGATYGSHYSSQAHQLPYWLVLVAQFFWINWVLTLLNVLIIGFPLDGGQMLQAALWPWLGYRQAMNKAIFAGFVFMFIIGVVSLVLKDPLWLCLAVFIYVSCQQQRLLLEAGGDESLFGYDFSQGYTSLERDQTPTPRRRRPNFFQRWLQRRAAKKLQRALEQQEADERRLDELLDKIHRFGQEALTEEERRFMQRVADRKRHRS